jgi:2-polyprenyl-6-hydroxyphenyl methylase/3-demethylubiquinone-9 3-methyltransferase
LGPFDRADSETQQQERRLAYRYDDAHPTWANHYLWPVVRAEAGKIYTGGGRRALDLGCGNGATSDMLASLGFETIGVDTSETGICQARGKYQRCRFEVASVYDDLAKRFGHFPLVVSLEVIEHLYDPRSFARVLHNLLEPGGIAIISTPYHGYFKNVALALSGRLDPHFTVLWDGGHIKFFSIATLRELLTEVGFEDIRFVRVGRIPPLAKSIVAVARRAAQSCVK